MPALIEVEPMPCRIVGVTYAVDYDGPIAEGRRSPLRGISRNPYFSSRKGRPKELEARIFLPANGLKSRLLLGSCWTPV